MLERLRKRPLIASILALFSSALFGRIMGTVYRVALVRAAGQETVGVIQLALPVYRIARSIATLGMPIAVAKLTAERTALGRQPDRVTYRLALSIMAYTALAGFFIQVLFSNFWARLVLGDERTEPAIIVLAVLLLPVAVAAAWRGAVQGLQRQSYMAGADVAEVLCRIPVTLILVAWLAPYGPALAAAGVAGGYLAGEVAGLLPLYRGLQRADTRSDAGRPGRAHQAGERRSTGRQPRLPDLHPQALLALSLPLMVTGLLNNAMSLVTVALIPRTLQAAGYSPAAATWAYGRLAGMAIPTLYMPMMLVQPVVAVAIPEITRLAAQKSAPADQRLFRLLRRIILGALAVTAVASPLLWYQGEWLAQVLYGDATVGELIRPLALAVPFTFLGSVITSVLLSLGKTTWTMLSSMAGNILRIVLICLLAARPEWGIMGVLWAYIGDSALTAVMAGIGLSWILARR